MKLNIESWAKVRKKFRSPDRKCNNLIMELIEQVITSGILNNSTFVLSSHDSLVISGISRYDAKCDNIKICQLQHKIEFSYWEFNNKENKHIRVYTREFGDVGEVLSQLYIATESWKKD